jgi:dolichyl-phosphate-mannose-protein mannosyltransferase
MPLGDYLVGLAFFAATMGSIGVAAGLIVRRRLGHLTGAHRILAFSVIATFGVIWAHLAPAALGVLARETVLASALLALAATSRVRSIEVADDEPPAPPSEPSGAVSSLLAGAAVAAVAVYALAYLSEHAAIAVTHTDLVSFHLPGVARWIQTRTVWDNNEFIPRYPVGNYPNNGDMLFLSAVLPWENDAFVRLVNYPFFALLGLVVYAIGRELGAPASAATIFAAVLLATRSVALPALDQLKPDVIMLATFGAGVLFLLRHWRTQRTSDLVLAGLGLGIAFGTRWHGVYSALAIVAAWAVAARLSGRPVKGIARQGAALAGLVGVGGGFWLVRNLAVTGNPVFPLKVAPLGITIFDAPHDLVLERFGYSIADYIGRPGVWRHSILPDYRHALGLAGLVVALGLLLAVAMAAERAWRRRPVPVRVIAIAAAVVLIAVAYAFSPASAQGFEGRPFKGIVAANARWLMPAFVLAASLAAWAVGRAGRLRPVLELAGVVAVASGIANTFDLQRSRVALVAVGLGLLLALAWITRSVSGRIRHRVAPSAYAAVALAIVVGVVALGQREQRRFNDGRYRSLDPTSDWIFDHAPSGHRVGIAGGWGKAVLPPVLPMFGPRLRNHVAYVGPLVEDMLQEYRRREPFVAAVERGRYDLLLIGRGFRPRPVVPEESWARAAGFAEVTRSKSYILFRRL